MVAGTRVSHTGVMTQDMTFNLCFLQPWSQHINDCDSSYVGLVCQLFLLLQVGIGKLSTSSELSFNPG